VRNNQDAHNLLMLGPPGSGKRVYMPQPHDVDPTAQLYGAGRGLYSNVLVTAVNAGKMLSREVKIAGHEPVPVMFR
jgi:hypothetical protein